MKPQETPEPHQPLPPRTPLTEFPLNDVTNEIQQASKNWADLIFGDVGKLAQDIKEINKLKK